MILLDPWLVVPGSHLGAITVGADPKHALAGLGRPQYGDAAMQKSWSTWIGKGGGRVDVFVSNDAVGTPRERQRIHAVRATSASFHLAKGFHPGSSAKSFRRAYPAAKAVDSYDGASGRVSIWDDVRRGLAWEVAPSGRVLALIVHAKGERLSSTVGPYVSSPLQKG